MREIYRQTIHLIAGILIAFSVLIFKKLLIIPLIISIVVGIGLYFLCKKYYIPIISDLLNLCKREKEDGKGAIYFAFGMLLSLILIDDINAIFFGILVFAVGDALATIVGIRGKIKINYFGKTIEGFLAFFISTSLILYQFYGIYGIFVALISAFVEFISKKIKIDDNLYLPFIVAFILSIYPYKPQLSHIPTFCSIL
ncbi:phosphatidate cytidylyltransferase [Methanocaldococcus bathoardescens]|uniref:Phosphatidate cytidylyltransferase n=1 Tax=Methanocaldococcus bathoardescens TaxID=1301915 RepID=A0A076LGJ4_9EURY|nr:diacylglycerol/polyprenol kinase family protein [Methanocaldococcus bathoardescens]AIJ05558.1 phosphatidate cytidylyltransferase [Methanocaldococcus bathoardescens]